MDPVVSAGDIAPIDAGIKIGHHATEHAKQHDKDDDGISDDVGIVSPWRHSISKAFEGMLRGGASIGLFTAVFKVVDSLFGTGGIFESIASASIGQGILAGALTGGIWYGGQAAIQAYNDAEEHNHNFIKRVQDKVRLRERMQSLGDMVPNFGIITADPGMAALQNGALLTENGEMLVPVALTEDGDAVVIAPGEIETGVNPDVDTGIATNERPDFLANILEQRQPVANAPHNTSHVAALEARDAEIAMLENAR